MKNFIFISLSSFALFFQGTFATAQILTLPQQNLEKYWIYRERLKNYMISGPAMGCDIVAQGREGATDRLGYSDAPWNIGYWIGTLAMEYDLLRRAGYDPSSPELMRTRQDLFYAIEAVNRIDCNADVSFYCASVDCPTNGLNGFSLSDDVPINYHTLQYPFANGETGSDLLNKSLVPPPDGFRIKCIDSGHAQYVINGREVSDDHVAGLFIGFALVKKCIPEDLTSSIPFTDFYNEYKYVKEVQNIANRFISWMASGEWLLRNLCSGNCVRGSCNPTKATFCGPHPASDTDPCPGVNDPCAFGSNSGAHGKSGAIGFVAANEYIQGQTQNSPTPALKGLVGNLGYRLKWNIDINDLPPPSPWKYALVAVGNAGRFTSIGSPPLQFITQDSPKNVAKFLVNDGVKEHWEHLSLLHRLLYGTQHKNNGDEIKIPDDYYKCLLNAAPCRGYDGVEITGTNTEWGWSDRLSGDRGSASGSAFSRLDFMFYFNLYNEVNSAYLGNQYLSLSINNLSKENIVKPDSPLSSHTEYDKKNFVASNSITAHASYIIDKDNTEGQGRVAFAAGKYVDLLPGFDVKSGATLNAYIDPNIGKMGCVNLPPGFTDCIAWEAGLKFESDSTDPPTFDTLHITVQDTSLHKEINPIAEQQKDAPGLDVSIIPNPSVGVFTFICKNDLQYIEMRDVLGNLVYSKVVNNIPVNMEIDISTQPSGIYFLKAHGGDKIYMGKVVLR